MPNSILDATRRSFGGWLAKAMAGFALLVLAACIEPGVSQGPRVGAGKPVIVGVLVPSESASEQQNAMAASLANAARLAASEAQATQNVQIDIRLYATGGDATRAAEAAQQAAQDGAKIIVGPLFAEAANAAGAAVAGRGISVLSFSNNTRIAGGNVFVLGDTFENTANRIVGFARGRGANSFGIVAQNGTAGDVAIAALQNATTNYGAIYAGSVRYDLNTQSVIDSIDQTKDLVRDAGAAALMLDATSSGALPVFAQLLPENGITAQRTQLLGLTRWDQTSDQIKAIPGLQGSLFAIPDTTAQAGFAARYEAAYGAKPHILASKAYDGVRAIGLLMATGQNDALSREMLTRPAGFTGANGIFRLLADGTNQRGLAVAEFREGQVVVIDPAPRGFGEPSN